MSQFVVKKKQPKNIAMQCFPEQFKRLHPERSASGGVKARSASCEVRMAVYRPIAEMFKRLHPQCECCRIPLDGKIMKHDRMK